MFCPNCGKRIAEGGSFCSDCGTRIAVAVPDVAPEAEQKKNSLALAGFIIALCSTLLGIFFCVVPAAGLALSVIGLIKREERHIYGRFALPAAIINAVWLVFWFFIIIAISI